MLLISDLYELFKPSENENKITSYPLIIGGGGGALDMVKGGWILSPLRSQNVTKASYSSFYKDLDDNLFCDLETLIQFDFQLDFYIAPNNKDLSLEYFHEAERIKAFLNSIDCIMYLRRLEAEILPCIRDIEYLSEFGAQELLINRAKLDFSIITKSTYKQDFKEFDKARINKSYIAEPNLKLLDFNK